MRETISTSLMMKSSPRVDRFTSVRSYRRPTTPQGLTLLILHTGGSTIKLSITSGRISRCSNISEVHPNSRRYARSMEFHMFRKAFGLDCARPSTLWLERRQWESFPPTLSLRPTRQGMAWLGGLLTAPLMNKCFERIWPPLLLLNLYCLIYLIFMHPTSIGLRCRSR